MENARWVSKSANIHPTAVIGGYVWIDPKARIGAGVVIGHYCWIGEGCVIEDGVTIGDSCTIGDYATVGADAVVGGHPNPPGINYPWHSVVVDCGAVVEPGAMVPARTRVERRSAD